MIVGIDLTTLRIQHGRRGRIDEGRALSRFGDASRRRLAEIDYSDQRQNCSPNPWSQQRVIEHGTGHDSSTIVPICSETVRACRQVTKWRKSRAP
ncbi:MAG: hypothetical protein IPJ30_13050 [Acidobacteria bacterium]|nr:hypothetical protein [Acidobacteriota bacterium]